MATSKLQLVNANADPVIVQLPVTVQPPPEAEAFLWNYWIDPTTNKPASVVVPAIGATAVLTSFTVPQNRSGRIWKIANGTGIGGGIANWVNGSGSLTWQILRNGSPFKNFPLIATLVGLVEQGGSELSAGLPLRANDNIALVVTNNSLPPAGQILVGLLGGYYYPAKLDPPNLRS